MKLPARHAGLGLFFPGQAGDVGGDRSQEHPGPAGKVITQARKPLRQAVKTVEAGGAPDGSGTSYCTLRAHEAVLPRDADWRAEMTLEMKREAILRTV